jgi:hypothetical protein
MSVVASAANGGLGSPAALTFGESGDLLISDRSNDSVLRVDNVMANSSVLVDVSFAPNSNATRRDDAR